MLAFFVVLSVCVSALSLDRYLRSEREKRAQSAMGRFLRRYFEDSKRKYWERL